MFAVQARCRVTTIEGLAKDAVLHPMQRASPRNPACNAASRRMIAAVDMVRRLGPELDEATIRHELEGHVPGTGYHNIVRAIEAGAAAMA
jgi:carbon-monoxide dehydrogenase small subunit